MGELRRGRQGAGPGGEGTQHCRLWGRLQDKQPHTMVRQHPMLGCTSTQPQQMTSDRSVVNQGYNNAPPRLNLEIKIVNIIDHGGCIIRCT